MTEWSTPTTRAQSCAHGAERRRRCGFSLLELLIALAIAALVAGLAAPAIGRALARDAERAQIVALVNHLSAVRLEAISALAPRTAELTWGEALGLRCEVLTPPTEGGGAAEPWVRAWPAWRLEPMARGDVQPLREAHVRFDPEGRTAADPLWFRAKGASDRLWSVRFDPVSGAPRAQPEQSEPGGRPTP